MARSAAPTEVIRGVQSAVSRTVSIRNEGSQARFVITVGAKKLTMDEDVFNFLVDKQINFTPNAYPVVFLHRMFFPDQPKGMHADHINQNPYDFRRINLRLVPHQVNIANGRSHRDATSRYKGVSAYLNHGKPAGWCATIRFQHKGFFLGAYDTEEDAAEAYDIAAIVLHPFVKNLNFPVSRYDGADLRHRFLSLLMRPARDNVSGERWVYAEGSGWKVEMPVVGEDGKRATMRLGLFRSFVDAVAARDEAAVKFSDRLAGAPRTIVAFCRRYGVDQISLRLDTHFDSKSLGITDDHIYKMGRF